MRPQAVIGASYAGVSRPWWTSTGAFPLQGVVRYLKTPYPARLFLSSPTNSMGMICSPFHCVYFTNDRVSCEKKAYGNVMNASFQVPCPETVIAANRESGIRL